MEKIKKRLSLLLVLTLALGLFSACGGTTDDPKDTNNTSNPDNQGYVYVPTYTNLSGNFSYIDQSCYCNDRIYFTGEVYTGETISQTYETGQYTEVAEPIMEEYSYEETRIGIFSVALDGSDLQELSDYKQGQNIQDADNPYSDYSYTSVSSIFGDAAGNIWLLQNVYTTTFDLPADFIDSEDSGAWQYATQTDEYFLCKLDSNGAELSRLDLSFVAEDQDYFYVSNVALDGEGNIYMVASSKVYVLDANGNKLFDIEPAGGWVDSVFSAGDGRVLVSMYNENSGGQVLNTIDLTAKGLGNKSYPCPYGAYNFITGGGEYDYYYNNGISLFGCNLETGDTEKIITWINSDVDSNNIRSIIPMENGQILALSRDYSSDDGKIELITMKQVPYSEVEHKEKITYACMWLDYNMRSAIIKFNRTNPNYRIEVSDYSEYNTEEDYSAGQTKLTTEILSGKVPNIFSTNALPIAQYGAKGLLEDLWPFIEGDNKIGGREGVVQPIFNALSTDDGRLYQLVPSSMIYAVLGASSIVGDEPGWTVEDAKSALASMPEGCEMFSLGSTQSNILNIMCNMGLDSFVDWETGKCSFDSDEFIQLLEFAKIFPESFDWDAYYNKNMEDGMYDDEILRILEGRQMLSTSYLYSMGYYMIYKKAFGGDITSVGFPGSNSGSAFYVDGGLAMSASCSNKDGAWEFMRILLDEQFQSQNYGYNGIPTNKKVFDSMIKDLMKKEYYTDYETGGQVEQPKETVWLNENNQIEVFALTQEEVDEIMDLINSTTRIYTFDDNLYDVIVDESVAFFAGQRSAQETAKNIQSSISLYVNEQR